MLVMWHLLHQPPPAKLALLQLEGGLGCLVGPLISHSYSSHVHHLLGRCLVHLSHNYPRGKQAVTQYMLYVLRWPNRLGAVPLPVPFAHDEAYAVRIAQLPTRRALDFTMGCGRSLNVLLTLVSMELEPLRERIVFELTPQEEELTSPRALAPPQPPVKKKKVKKKQDDGEEERKEMGKVQYTTWPPPQPGDIVYETAEAPPSGS